MKRPPCDKLPVKNGKLATLLSQACHALVTSLSRPRHKAANFCDKFAIRGVVDTSGIL